MSDEVRTMEIVITNTRQQLAQAMASNAELAAMLQIAQERIAALESDDDVVVEDKKSA